MDEKAYLVENEITTCAICRASKWYGLSQLRHTDCMLYNRIKPIKSYLGRQILYHQPMTLTPVKTGSSAGSKN